MPMISTDDSEEEEFTYKSHKIAVTQDTLTLQLSGKTHTASREGRTLVWSDGDRWESMAVEL